MLGSHGRRCKLPRRATVEWRQPFSIKIRLRKIGCPGVDAAQVWFITNLTGTCTLVSVWGLDRHRITALRRATSRLQSPVVFSIFIDATRPVFGSTFKRNTPAPVLYSRPARLGYLGLGAKSTKRLICSAFNVGASALKHSRPVKTISPQSKTRCVFIIYRRA